MPPFPAEQCARNGRSEPANGPFVHTAPPLRRPSGRPGSPPPTKGHVGQTLYVGTTLSRGGTRVHVSLAERAPMSSS